MNDKNYTNADRIRNMSDEELAELMSNISTCDNCFANLNDNCSSVSNCNLRYLDWLKSNSVDINSLLIYNKRCSK